MPIADHQPQKFRFRQFEILQSEKVFKVGTDGVLLGVLCSCEKAKNILEIGSGTGLISLMIAQRNPAAKISAIDIDEHACKLASRNFENSPFKTRLKSFHQDFKTFNPQETFDFIVSNPPYFDINASKKNVLARQTLELDFRDLISGAAKHLSETGVFSVIVPNESYKKFIEIAEEFQFYLIRKINIIGIEGGKTKRLILEFSKQKSHTAETDFVVREKSKKYSSEYIDLTKKFHNF
ncbi:MAG: methyltransferase [Flavobacteriaceae bacterium]|jgi:tRNA1Val (adenine37-N6)-methyltransferase|nr:methyltransferase [Flavobacteriaceae bacterium]